MTTANQNQEFEDWLRNPPEEYQELFSDIAQASAEFDQGMTEVRQGIAELHQAADSLDQAAQDCRAEANQLGGDRQARLQDLETQHLAVEAEYNGIHPDGCYNCGGDHSTIACLSSEEIY